MQIRIVLHEVYHPIEQIHEALISGLAIQCKIIDAVSRRTFKFDSYRRKYFRKLPMFALRKHKIVLVFRRTNRFWNGLSEQSFVLSKVLNLTASQRFRFANNGIMVSGGFPIWYATAA